MGGERIAKLYAELGDPGATKFQSALHKQGVKLPLDGIKDPVKNPGLTPNLQATAQVRRRCGGEARCRQVGR